MSDTSQKRDQPFDRAFALLEAVAAAKRPVSVTDLSTMLELPAPTVHRLVAQLLERDILKREMNSKRVLTGARLRKLGADILEAAMLADPAHVVLLNLANELREHCQVGIVTEGEVAYVDTARLSIASGLQFQPGKRAPLHCTSIGKLYLSSLPPAVFATWLKNAPLARFTDSTIVDPNALAAEIEQVRQRGWAMSLEQYVEGVSGFAVPILKDGHFMAGLGIAGPAIRLKVENSNEILPKLHMAAAAIAKLVTNP